MASGRISAVVDELRRAALLPEASGLRDAELLEAFVSRRDQSALTVLVRRHGPMVWGVCRRLLRDFHDAEDAFQATFLVLLRKASSIAPRGMIANWLYGVAYQTSLKARALAARRKEKQVLAMPEPAAPEPAFAAPADWRDLQRVLDQELSRLPQKYRVLVVLCDLEGKTRKSAAEELSLPEGTVAGRLARARAFLAKRLSRRGVTLAGAFLAGSGLSALLTEHASAAAVPAALLLTTIKAVSLSATGAATAGVTSAHVAALTQGVLQTMFFNKLKLAAAVLVIACLVGTGVGAGLLAAQNSEPDQPSAKNAPDQSEARQKKQTEDKRLEVLTKELTALRKELKPPAPVSSGPMEYRMFRDLADSVFATLKSWSSVLASSSALACRRVRIAAHASSNTIVVRGPAAELEVVEAIVVRLDSHAAEGSELPQKK